MSVLVLVALTELFAAFWNAPPVSLGELAFREAVRRQAAPASVRVVTDADLGPMPERVPPKKSEVPAQVEPVTPETPPADLAAPKDQAWWRARMVAALAAVERDQVLEAALISRIAALTRDVANRDNPVERAALAADRLRAIEELDLVRKQTVADTRAITDIEDEARKAGVPPGWLRGGAPTTPTR